MLKIRGLLISMWTPEEIEACRVAMELSRGRGPYMRLSSLVAETLPLDVREQLVGAANVQPDLRALAIDQAIQRAKGRYPNIFKEEN